MKYWLPLMAGLLFMVGCGGSTTKTREIGYKGKARIDAYLAANRFLERMGHRVVNESGWPELDYEAGVLMMPASILTTDAYLRDVEEWVVDGGHLICLVEHAEAYLDDWSGEPRRLLSDGDSPYPEALDRWLQKVGLRLGLEKEKRFVKERLPVNGGSFEVFTEATVGVSRGAEPRSSLATEKLGEGLVSVLTDARPFRNRFIDEHEHAGLLLELVNMSPYQGHVIFVRDAGLSLWALLWQHGWPALLGLLAVTVFWLWRHMPRFGPMRRDDVPSKLRSYDHHLEALGDFQWRLDKGESLLRPLRESILERAQHLAESNYRDGDLFAWIAQRTGIERERAARAMTLERPSDATSFTRLVTDLQRIHHSLS